MSSKLNLISKSLSSLAVCGAFGIAVLASSSVVHAQSQPGNPLARSWYKVCSKQGENNICNVQFQVTADTGQLVTAVNLLSVTGKIKRQIFQIAVPSGRFIPAGVSVSIDGGKGNKLPYSICLPSRCMAEVPLSAGLLKALKKGGELMLTSTNFQNKKSPIKVSLNGFTAAYEGNPIKRTELQNRQKKLQEELQKKAEAARKKLEEAQKKAKE
jgi:invasion protein IalB